MIPGCTSALPIEIDDQTLDLSDAQVWVTIEQGETKITASGENVTVTGGNTVTAYFTQAETLRLLDNVPAKGQVNWIYDESGAISRGSTDPFSVNIGEQLLRRVLP